MNRWWTLRQKETPVSVNAERCAEVVVEDTSNGGEIIGREVVNLHLHFHCQFTSSLLRQIPLAISPSYIGNLSYKRD